ncbi:hypothetical protein NFHSH190041_06950 [Shewanella sp. NFH-SH190041]|uniref:inhibitor of vertebrate lysozyme family protein n=1 Tax=Shewanella sp. NFH-SH190041 TaxID=2950245 RepID=UPI0021C3F9C6|nr:inhibitor of vertebrate lysozyme family protein [Shewanella sp. NFH-SH190041]BDM63243.1 hypothetical protein NFHSH190041_06950 [Shewanella sp. NFH-SH190041]
MKNVLLAAGVMVALVGCHSGNDEQKATSKVEQPTPVAESAQQLPTIPAVSNKPIPAWVYQQSKVTAPMGNVQIAGKTYTATNFCKPHDCGGNFMITLTADNTAGVSLVVAVEDVDAAIITPSKYATYWFMGNPSHAEQQMLVKLLNENPNWQ